MEEPAFNEGGLCPTNSAVRHRGKAYGISLGHKFENDIDECDRPELANVISPLDLGDQREDTII